jgi:type VI secretion system protein ImpE
VSAEQTLRDGRPDQALEELKQAVRQNPADSKLRIFLFQLLAVQGQWSRALAQLNTAAELDPSALVTAQMYREVLHCEALRAEVFSGKHSPLIFGQPPEWIGLLVEALRLTTQGQHEAGQRLRNQALEAAPATSGTVDGRSFAWIADADLRLGPVLEAVVAGRYFWVPIENIQSIRFEQPSDLRDLVWLPAQFTWANGGQAIGVIPTRYPGSEASPDPLIRLARKTEWLETDAGLNVGLGQRLLATDEEDIALLDVRQIDLDTGDATRDAPPAEAPLAEPQG